MSKFGWQNTCGILKRLMIVFFFSAMLYMKQVMYHPYNLNKGKVGIIVAICIFLTSWTMIISERRQIRALLIVDVIVSIIILSDKVYFRYYNAPISISVLYQIGLVSSVFESVKALFRTSDIFYILDILVFEILVLYIRVKRPNIFTNDFRKLLLTRILLFSISILISFTLAFYKIDQIISSNSGLLTSVFNNNYIEYEMGILAFHFVDSYKYVNENILGKSKMTSEDLNDVNQYFNNKANTLKPQFYGEQKGKNIIILQVEALQAFVINREFNGREITPNLNKLIKESTYYNNFYTQAAGGNTSDAEFLTNNSLFPAKEGAVYFKYPMNEFNSLPKILSKQGYFTAAMHGYSPEFWNRQVMYKSLGFDKFYYNKDYKIVKTLGMGIGDKEFLAQSLDKLLTLPHPFYSFLISLTSHYPFNALEGNNDFDVKDYKNTLLGNYLKSINYTDAAIGEFIQGLKQKGLYDSSILIIYGDHDAIDLNHYNELQSFLNEDKDTVLLHENRRIPLIIHTPGLQQGKQIESIGGEIDTLPTLLNLLGINDKYSMGSDLNNSNNNIVIFRDGSFIEKNYRYFSNENKMFNVPGNKSAGAEDFKQSIKNVTDILKISDEVMTNNLLKRYNADK